MATCFYCKYYNSAKLLARVDKSDKAQKKCIVSRKNICIDSEQCKYFDPADIFYCDEYNCRIHITQCLQRRFNPKNFISWEPCKKCRQFQKDNIQEIVNEYFINKKQIVKRGVKKNESDTGRVLKRKDIQKPVKSEPQKRVLKRKKKDKPIRKLKRKRKANK